MKNIKGVTVVFYDGGKGYHYKVPEFMSEVDYNIGDCAIVFANERPVVVEIVEIYETVESIPVKATKYLADTINLTTYFELVNKEQRQAQVKAKLEARFQEAEKMALYKALAEHDPEMKALLKELQSLG